MELRGLLRGPQTHHVEMAGQLFVSLRPFHPRASSPGALQTKGFHRKLEKEFLEAYRGQPHGVSKR